jgi:TIR domain
VLEPGTSLSSSIDHGLAVARFGVVILSPSFFQKNWPKYELAGLKARQLNGQQVILPIWHNVSVSEVLQFSPPLADMLAYDSSKHSIEEIAEGILQTVRPEEHSAWLVQRIRKALSAPGTFHHNIQGFTRRSLSQRRRYSGER